MTTFDLADPIPITVFGSCRVVGPSRQLELGGHVRLVNSDNLWYTHHVLEAVQKVFMLTGRCEVPAHLLPCVIDSDSHPMTPATFRPDYFKGTAAAVIEISTARALLAGPYSLHHTSVEKARRLGQEVPAYDYVPYGKVQLHRQMTLLAEEFGQVIFVSPITLTPDGSEPPPQRARLRDAIASNCDGRTMHHFDPMLAIAELGPGMALTDINHYSPAGASAVAVGLLATLRRVLGGASAAG